MSGTSSGAFRKIKERRLLQGIHPQAEAQL